MYEIVDATLNIWEWQKRAQVPLGGGADTTEH